MNQYPHIMLGQPIVIDLNEMKGKNMTQNEAQTAANPKPIISIGDVDIELDLNKPSERYIITKKYQGYKLFYKMHRRACHSYLSKGTHFETYDKAKEHFDSFIKTNWKHTKQFQIEPVSNFFISDWRLVTEYNSYSSHYDLGERRKVILRNVHMSIDEYKHGKKTTTVKELLERFVAENKKHDDWNNKTVADLEAQIKRANSEIDVAKGKIIARQKRLTDLLQNETIIQQLIEDNTTEAERTVKLFYGQE